MFRLWPLRAEPIVIKQALNRLKVQKEWLADPARAHHEALILALLYLFLGSKHVPMLLLEDTEHHIIAMTSAPEEATNWKHDMLTRRVFDRGVARKCGELLGKIQSFPIDASMPQDLHDKSFFHQLRVDAYILHLVPQFPALSETLTELAADLMAAKSCITHADFTPKNILVGPQGPIILDYEVAHYGHPAFDPASIVNHLYLKSRALPEHSAELMQLAEDFLEGYLSVVPGAALPPKFWTVLGALALARIHGKSPVEYLTDAHTKASVTRAGIALIEGQIQSAGQLWQRA